MSGPMELEPVLIARHVVEELIAHARAEAPNESCGLLIGRAGLIGSSVRARNLLASPTRYLIDPQDHFSAIREARAAGLAVVGAYHSHPSTEAVPSPSDLAEATYPDYLYVIVSPAAPQGPEVRAYWLNHDSYTRVPLTQI